MSATPRSARSDGFGPECAVGGTGDARVSGTPDLHEPMVVASGKQRFVGGVAESNAPVAPGEVPESRLAAPDEGTGATLCGVSLRDVYRDANGDLWEVIGLCDRPQATFRRVSDDRQVEHVIGCLNMRAQFPDGALREVGRGN